MPPLLQRPPGDSGLLHVPSCIALCSSPSHSLRRAVQSRGGVLRDAARIHFVRREVPPTASSVSSSALAAWDATSRTPAKRTTKFVGLRNQGATCYLNSLVQALYMTPKLRQGVMAFTREGGAAAGSLSRALSGVFQELSTCASAVTRRYESAHYRTHSRTHSCIRWHTHRRSPGAVSTEKLTKALNWGPVSRQQVNVMVCNGM